MPTSKPAHRARASLVPGFSCWPARSKTITQPGVNSYLGLFFSFLILVLVVGGGALIWYLSTTTEFSRAPSPPAAATSTVAPEAASTRPPAPANRR